MNMEGKGKGLCDTSHSLIHLQAEPPSEGYPEQETRV